MLDILDGRPKLFSPVLDTFRLDIVQNGFGRPQRNTGTHHHYVIHPVLLLIGEIDNLVIKVMLVVVGGGHGSQDCSLFYFTFSTRQLSLYFILLV